MKNILLGFFAVVAVVSVIANYLLYERWLTHHALFVVNGETITKKDLDDRVDYLYAKPLLNKMIWEKLVVQEAKKKNCMPSDADVAADIADIDRNDPSVTFEARKNDPALLLFKEDERAVLALRNLQVLNVTVTDGDVATYYGAHKADFATKPQSVVTAILTASETYRDTAKRLLDENVAPDVIAGTAGMQVLGYNAQLTGTLPQDVSDQLLKLQPGQVGVYTVGDKYLVAKLVSISPGETPTLDKIRDKVTMAARLARAPSQATVLADVRRRAEITAETDGYKDAIPSLTPQDTTFSAN